MNDGELLRLIENVRQQPKGSWQHKISLDRLLRECQALPGLLESSHPSYLEALNDTWEWVWRNIKRFEPRLSSVRQSLVVWINSYLYWRIKDLYIVSNIDFPSLDELLQENEDESELVERLCNLRWSTGSYSLLEDYIKLAEIEEIRRIGLAVAQEIKTDLRGRLKSIHLKERADCNCKILSQRLLLKAPPDTLALVSRELGVNPKTLLYHWKNKCKPCLQEIAIELNYRPK